MYIREDVNKTAHSQGVDGQLRIVELQVPFKQTSARRQKAPREESLYSKLFKLFELVGYFRRAVLGKPVSTKITGN
jgi:hypothetical protein